LTAPLDQPPIDVELPPLGGVEVDPERELAKLRPAEAKSDSAKLLEQRAYLKVIQLLSKEPLSAAESNDLGCAWAWRAQREKRFDYWGRAVEALRTAAKDKKTKSTAEANLAIVYRVGGLI
jgi:hypothetical protein